MPAKVILISGGFDPIHEGHIDLIEAAANYGRLWIALNSDAWLMRKKSYVFQKWDARARILGAIKGVEFVSAVDDDDGTVAKAIIEACPAYFANGGDRTEPNELEAKVCAELGVKMLFGIGGVKIQSSSDLVRRIAE